MLQNREEGLILTLRRRERGRKGADVWQLVDFKENRLVLGPERESISAVGLSKDMARAGLKPSNLNNNPW